MLVMLFVILFFFVIGKLIHLAIKMAWGITKVLFSVVFFPIILIGLALAGFVWMSIILLIIVGFISLVAGLVTG